MHNSNDVVRKMERAIKAARQLHALGDLTKTELKETISMIVAKANSDLNA